MAISSRARAFLTAAQAGTASIVTASPSIACSTTGLVTRVESGTIDTPSDTTWATFEMLERLDISYDGAQRPIRHTLIGEDGAIYSRSQTSYDDEGLVECVAVRMNPAEFATLPPSACIHGSFTGFGRDRITRTLYDENHRVSSVQTGWGLTADPENEVPEAAFAYRANGTVYHVTDGNLNRTTYLYDGHDRLRQIRYPLPDTPVPPAPPASDTTNFELFTYDANSNVVSFRNRSNRTALFQYDALDRLTRHDRYNTTSDITYSYDLLGRMLSATQSGLSVAFTWDALGRLISETGPLGTVTSQYDLAGRRTRVTHPSGFFTEHDYLLTGEMSRVEAGGTTLLATYGYDDLGRRISLTRGSGVVTSYGYDEGPWLASISHDPAGTAYDLALGFAYNPAGQIVSNTRSDPGSGPGQADRYAYTGHANASVTDTRNGLNQIVTTGGLPVDHNSRGDIDALPTPGSPAGNTTEYTYSDEDRMVTAEVGITLTYDPLGRLYQVSSPAGGVRRFAYDGTEVIGEYDAAGTYLHRYVHGPGVDELLVWDDRSLYPTLSRRYAHADERGSIIAYSDSTTDTVTHVNRYDEYGRPQDNAVAGRFGYTGQMWVPELGMYYYRARIYNPNLGRFMQPDPIGYASGMNRYAYVGGDPVNATDPSGLTPPPSDPVCTGTRLCAKVDWGPGNLFGGASYVTSYAGFSSFIRGGSRGGSAGGSGSTGPSAGTPGPTPGGDGIIVTGTPFTFGFDPNNALGIPVEQGILVTWTRRVSDQVISAAPVDELGFTDLGAVQFGQTFLGRHPEFNLRGLTTLRLLSRFTSYPQCGWCLHLDPLRGSYLAAFYDNEGGNLLTVTIHGRVGLVLSDIIDIPGRATALRLIPFILTPPNTEVLVRGRR